MIVKVTKVIHEALHAQIDQLQRKIDLQTKSSSARLAVVDTVITNLIEAIGTEQRACILSCKSNIFNEPTYHVHVTLHINDLEVIDWLFPGILDRTEKLQRQYPV